MERAKAAAVATRLALGQPDASTALSQRRDRQQLADANLAQFEALMQQMWAYYPSQNFSPETVEGFEFDLERLAAIHGLPALRTILLALRIRPGQRFFPHPSEVAEELEAMAKTEAAKTKFRPDPECECQKHSVRMDGWTWVMQEGRRVVARCNCWKRWAGQMATPQGDRKSVAAGA